MMDIRLIVHRTPTSLLLCYVGHHDAAYAWAERRKIERHPVTGAAQLVELRERVKRSRYLGRQRLQRPPARNRSYSSVCRTERCSVTAFRGMACRDAPRQRGHAARPCRSPTARGGRGAAEPGDRRYPGEPGRSLLWTNVRGPTVTTPKPDADPFRTPTHNAVSGY